MVWYQDWAKARTTLRALAGAVKADGCSSSPDLFFKECCDEHDVYYRTGKDAEGRPISRQEADRRLRKCQQRFARLKRKGVVPVLGPFFWQQVVPWVYWGAVRGWNVSWNPRSAWYEHKKAREGKERSSS